MSKDVVIAGVIVAACLGLVTVAFVVPRHKTTSTDLASLDSSSTELTPTSPNTPSDPFASSDPFAPTNPQVTTKNSGTNPFAPIGQLPPDNYTPPTNTFPPIKPPTNAFPPTNLPPVTPVEPAQPITNVNNEKTHVVAAGETLGEISQKYYNTARNWKEIAEANKVDPSSIQVGQKLTIPVLASTSTATTPSTPMDLASGERTYKVQKGDSYYRIAERELGNAARWKELEKLNNISAENLREGKVIKLPEKEAAVTSLPTTNTTTPSDGKVHVVASGETLSDISTQHYGTSKKWKEIVKANPGIDPEGLRVGQKLNLPDIAGTAPTPTTSTPSTSDFGATEKGNYTVKAGDTLGSIAERELGSNNEWKKIVDANPGLDPRKLRIGQKLIIPGKSAGTSTPAPAPKNNGFGFGEAGNGGFGGNANPPAENPFAPSPFRNTTPPPTNDGFGSDSGDAGYPVPPSRNPPGGTPPNTLPDSFGGSSGFGNSP